MKQKLYLIVLVIVLFSPNPLFSTDLSDLIDAALKENLLLKVAKLRIETSGLDVKKAHNAFIPNADLQFVDSQKTFLDSGQKASSWSFGTTILSSLNIIQSFPALGKAAVLQRDVAKLKSDAADFAYRKEALEMTRRLIKVYFELVKEEEMVKIHTENLLLLGKLLEIANINLQVGLALQNDILRIEVQQANLETSLVKSKSAIEMRYLDLADILNSSSSASISLQLPQSLRYDLASFSASELGKLLEDNDFDLLLSRNDRDILQKIYQAAKNAALPTLNLGGNYTYGKDVSGLKDTRDYTVNFSLSMPVYDSGDLSLEVRRAKKSLDIASLTRENLLNSKRTALAKALADYDEVKKRIFFTEKALEQSRENMRIVATRYQAGDASIVELVDAQITLTSSAQTAVSAYYDERTRCAEILLITNQMEPLRTLDQGAIAQPHDWEYLAQNFSGTDTPEEARHPGALQADPSGSPPDEVSMQSANDVASGSLMALPVETSTDISIPESMVATASESVPETSISPDADKVDFHSQP